MNLLLLPKQAAQALREASEAGDDCSVQDWEQASYDAQALIGGLESHVHVAIEHPHANYVIQQVAKLSALHWNAG